MAFCKNCGEQLSPGTKFCGSCGAPADDAQAPPSPAAKTGMDMPEVPNAPGKSKPFPHFYLITGIVVVVIIIAALIVTGIVSFDVAVTVKDPIVGNWKATGPDGSDVRVRFDANGTVSGTGYNPKTMETSVQNGKWSSFHNNSYEIIWSDGYKFPVILDPARKVIYDPAYPNNSFTPYK